VLDFSKRKTNFQIFRLGSEHWLRAAVAEIRHIAHPCSVFILEVATKRIFCSAALEVMWKSRYRQVLISCFYWKKNRDRVTRENRRLILSSYSIAPYDFKAKEPLSLHFIVCQWFSTFSLKGVESRPTIRAGLTNGQTGQMRGASRLNTKTLHWFFMFLGCSLRVKIAEVFVYCV